MLRKKDHFTVVVGLLPEPSIECEAEVHIVLDQSGFLENCPPTLWSIRSTPASFPSITVQWSIPNIFRGNAFEPQEKKPGLRFSHESALIVLQTTGPLNPPLIRVSSSLPWPVISWSSRLLSLGTFHQFCSKP